MKKILLMLCVALCAQWANAQNITFGVKGGLNLASLNDNLPVSLAYKYKFGFQAGGFARIDVAERLYVQPELMYALQGVKYNVEVTSISLPQTDPLFGRQNIDVTVSESNVILPVMLKYYFNDAFNAEVGPQLDYLFSAKTKAEGIGSVTESFSDFNFGFNIGLGYDVNEKIGLGVRYHYGLNRADRDFPGKVRNSIFSLNAEYRFN